MINGILIGLQVNVCSKHDYCFTPGTYSLMREKLNFLVRCMHDVRLAVISNMDLILFIEWLLFVKFSDKELCS